MRINYEMCFKKWKEYKFILTTVQIKIQDQRNVGLMEIKIYFIIFPVIFELHESTLNTVNQMYVQTD